MRNLEDAFNEEMVNIYRKALDECRYQASYFLNMVTDKGGKNAALELITSSKPSDGFTKLWSLRRLDLTVEALVLQKPWSTLFSDEVLAIARRRLQKHGYEP